STGLKVNKFGVPLDDARELFASMRDRTALQLVAVHLHIGSQITVLEPLRRAAVVAAAGAAHLLRSGVPLEYLDVGGGRGISYRGVEVASTSDYVSELLAAVRPTSLPIAIEPGRSIVGPAGVLVARVVDLKPRTTSSDFAVLDAGMTEFMRPALYEAY